MLQTLLEEFPMRARSQSWSSTLTTCRWFPRQIHREIRVVCEWCAWGMHTYNCTSTLDLGCHTVLYIVYIRIRSFDFDSDSVTLLFWNYFCIYVGVLEVELSKLFRFPVSENLLTVGHYSAVMWIQSNVLCIVGSSGPPMDHVHGWITWNLKN